MRQVLVIGVLAWVSAACSMIGGREAAPQAFRDTACRAFESLTFSRTATTLGRADLAAEHLAEGQVALAIIPAWEPGTAFVDRLLHVSEVIITGGDASSSLEQVGTEYRELYDRNAFTCDWIFRPLPSPLWPPASDLPAA